MLMASIWAVGNPLLSPQDSSSFSLLNSIPLCSSHHALPPRTNLSGIFLSIFFLAVLLLLPAFSPLAAAAIPRPDTRNQL